ncbi:MAG: hypothetical protein LBF77_07050, partial [Spirochaetaceae bacterium]|nr:hypothetical protein [Spirochaetaceae bacterium]
MKKFVLLWISIVLIVSLAGCNKGQPDDGGSSRTSSEGVSGSLTVWMDNDDWANAVIEVFTQKYPDVKVSYQKIGN